VAVRTLCFDLRKIGDTGIGRMITTSLTPILARGDDDWRYVLIVREGVELEQYLGSARERVTVIREDARNYSWRELAYIPILVARLRPDLLYVPHYTVPLVTRRLRLVVTIHDVIHLRLNDRRLDLVRRAYAHSMIRRAARADCILVPSVATKRDLLEIFNVDERRLRIVPNCADPLFQPQTAEAAWQTCARYGITGPFILYVGMWKPHKNLPTLIEAFGQLRNQLGWRGQLVLIGTPDPRARSRIQDLIQRAAIARDVVILDFVSDTHLRDIYSAATALVQPSLYEGWGLPVSEAMACGTPVICSTAGSLPEVAGSAALMFEPTDHVRLVTHLQTVTSSPGERTRLSNLGLERARLFSPERTADLMLAAFQDVLNDGWRG